MRTVRLAAVIAAFLLVAIACGDDDATVTTQPGGGGVATTTATTAGSIGGGSDGSIVFQISGGYERSGEFTFVPAASVFSNGGWSASFTGDDDRSILSVVTIPGTFAVSFGDASVVVTGGEFLGCSFELTQNDSSGFAGSFSCDDLDGFTQAGTAITVDFSGSFSS